MDTYTQHHSCVTEMPLTIKVNDIEFATIICSPNHLEELTLGFQHLIFLKRNDLQSIHIDESKVISCKTNSISRSTIRTSYKTCAGFLLW